MPQTLIIILGPPAVGKMTVGLELARLTAFKFMHNHQMIEALLPTFPFGSPPFLRLLLEFRRRVCEEVAASDASGFVYTTAWDVSSDGDRAEIDSYCDPFRRTSARIHFVELEATLETRLARNRTELRLLNKASKRDVQASEQRLIRIYEKTKQETRLFPFPESYLKIANDRLSPVDAAHAICRAFRLPENESSTSLR